MITETLETNFDILHRQLVRDNNALERKYLPKDAIGSLGNYIDIDSFLDVLYNLLESNNYIITDDEKDVPGKFLFTEENPDISVSSSQDNRIKDTIVFEIVRREPASMSSNADPFAGTKHYRPILIGEENDGNEGGRVIHLAHFYDNLIRFTCYSTKQRQARQLATQFESILNKYYFIIKKYAPVMVYLGRGNGKLANQFGTYQGVPLELFVRTCEHTMLREQEINSIETNINIIGTY